MEIFLSLKVAIFKLKPLRQVYMAVIAWLLDFDVGSCTSSGFDWLVDLIVFSWLIDRLIDWLKKCFQPRFFSVFFYTLLLSFLHPGLWWRRSTARCNCVFRTKCIWRCRPSHFEWTSMRRALCWARWTLIIFCWLSRCVWNRGKFVRLQKRFWWRFFWGVWWWCVRACVSSLSLLFSSLVLCCIFFLAVKCSALFLGFLVLSPTWMRRALTMGVRKRNIQRGTIR